MELKGLKINFLGDSITEGYGTSSEQTTFHNVLKEMAGLDKARNYGIGGTRFALQSGTPERPKDDYVDVNSFSERFDKMDDDADVVVVFGGTNDFGHGDAPIGKKEDRTPETFYGACHFLFGSLIEKYLGKPIVIMTPLHRSDLGGEINAKGIALKEYVDIIREVAEIYSLPVLDLYAASGIAPQLTKVKESFMPDGLHPNDAGHRLIAQRLFGFLKSL